MEQQSGPGNGDLSRRAKLNGTSHHESQSKPPGGCLGALALVTTTAVGMIAVVKGWI